MGESGENREQLAKRRNRENWDNGELGGNRESGEQQEIREMGK